MKKGIMSLFAMAMMLLGTSCSEDVHVPGVEEDMSAVTFSLGIEEDIETRALSNQKDISDGLGADVLMYAVFNKDGKRVSAIYNGNGTRLDTQVNGKVVYSNVTFPKQETILLPKGQTFTIAFWAQNGECKAYTVSDDMQLSVDYENAINNDERKDAFFKTIQITVKGSESLNVVLRRPFAQLNVGVTDTDWNAAVGTGVTINKSKVKIDNVATSMDLLTGKVSGYKTVEFGLHPIPATFTPNNDGEEYLWVDMDEDGTLERYKYLSMTYLLVYDYESAASDQKVLLNNAYFEFHAPNATPITLGGLNKVPVRRNWRTNIIGQILTGNVTFNIKICPCYYGDYNTNNPEVDYNN